MSPQRVATHSCIGLTAGAERFRADGYTVEELKSGLPKEELIAKLKDVYILGIRSATDVTKEGAGQMSLSMSTQSARPQCCNRRSACLPLVAFASVRLLC